jgi:hypothetical protein
MTTLFNPPGSELRKLGRCPSIRYKKGFFFFSLTLNSGIRLETVYLNTNMPSTDIIAFLFHWYTANALEINTTAIDLATAIWRPLPSSQGRGTEDAVENQEGVILLFVDLLDRLLANALHDFI